MGDIKPSHRGLLHKDLHVPEGKKISTAQLEEAKKYAGPKVMKRIVYAENARK